MAQGELQPFSWLSRAARAHPRRTALILGEQTFDFAGLHDTLGKRAGRLRAAGVAVHQGLAVISERADTMAWALYVSLYAGHPLVLLDPRRPQPVRLLDDCFTTTVVSDAGAEDSARPHMSENVLTDPTDHDPAPSRPLATDAIQLVVFTSGSTGRPRGVMLTGSNLAAAVQGSSAALPLGAGDIWLACMPLFHIAGVSILLRCAEAAATTLLHDGFDAARVWSDLHEHRVTHLSLVPAMLQKLVERSEGQAPPPSLRAVLVGGGTLADTLALQALRTGWPLCPTYGLSEITSQVATRCATEPTWETGHVGPPLPQLQVDIVDGSGRHVDGQGRIRIGGPAVMAGYANPEGRRGMGLQDGRFTTSDLGYIDPAGHLHIVGRADDVLVSGGENIHPEEVEQLLSGCPGVTEVGITGIPDPVWGQKLVAVYAGAPSEGELCDWSRSTAAGTLRPRLFLRVDALPRNAGGKLDRGALRQCALQARARNRLVEVDGNTAEFDAN